MLTLEELQEIRMKALTDPRRVVDTLPHPLAMGKLFIPRAFTELAVAAERLYYLLKEDNDRTNNSKTK